MKIYIHPARSIPYDDLLEGLAAAYVAGLVSRKVSGDHALYCYTPAAVYDRKWDAFTLMARGLILDHKRRCVVATPFPKFFNLGETAMETVPDLGFEVLEKLDGSLIIVWHDGEAWRCCTKGSFDSAQARAAREWIGERTKELVPGFTYLAEWIAPDNRIVVRYERPELVLLAAFDSEGNEHDYSTLELTAEALGWRLAPRHDFTSLTALVEHAGTLPATAEGFVLRFQNGLRLKIKGEEYRRIHALISDCTPLAMWEAMKAGDDLDLIRRQLPEEFWGDFDAITATLNGNLSRLVNAIQTAAAPMAGWTDKEVGLRLDIFREPVRRFIFPYRKGNLTEGRAREALFRTIRPTGNVLAGYTPSYAINRVQEESL